jgi:hypothetical protein
MSEAIIFKLLDFERQAQGFGEGDHLVIVTGPRAEKRPDTERGAQTVSRFLVAVRGAGVRTCL